MAATLVSDLTHSYMYRLSCLHLDNLQASIVGRALMEHVDATTSKGWSLPDLEDLEVRQEASIEVRLDWHAEVLVPHIQDGAVPATPPRLEIGGVWPYWKSSNDPNTVRNDLCLERTILLTGPNMAGGQ